MSQTEQLDQVPYEVLKKIADCSHDEIWIHDKNLEIIYVNNVCEKNTGLKAEDIVGKNGPELARMTGIWSPSVSHLAYEEKRQITIEQTTTVGKRLLTTVTPILNEAGEVDFLINVMRDLEQMDAIKHQLEQSKLSLSEKRCTKENDCKIIAHSKVMKQLVEFAKQVAPVDSTVLILGESGTGKGVIAQLIHNSSLRSKGPFLEINCAAIPEDLLESELFGYSHGAFTGADKGGKKGLIEAADGGTLFLDEIGELSPRLQAKILQVIQTRRFIPVGSTETKNADIRIISATNRDLIKLVKERRFRDDLYYRLNVIELQIPPLRERPDDIIPLMYFFLNKFDKKYNSYHLIEREALDKVCQYSWAGNVRELENLVERLVVTVRDRDIQACHLPNNILRSTELECKGLFPINTPLDKAKEEIEKDLVVRAYQALGSSRKVAKTLNISNTRAWRLISKYCDDSPQP